MNDDQIKTHVLQLQNAGAPPEDIENYVKLAVQERGTFSQNQPQADNRDLLEKTGNIVNKVFPGKQVGKAIGTLGGYVYQKGKDLLTGSNIAQNYDLSAPSPLQVGGDIAQGALAIAAPEIGSGSTVLGRIGANAALGAGLGATGAIAEGRNTKEILQSGALGGLVGGGASAVAEGIGAIVDNLPRWLTKKALPKLQSNNVDYALKNTKLGSIETLKANSDKAVSSYGQQIQAILEHPEYINETGNGASSFQGVIEDFPNANLNTKGVVNTVKKVVPGSERLVEKIANGTANLLEKNQLRQQLDLATKKVFTDSPDITFNKQIAHSLANTLRNEVKSVAPETEPIFEKFAQEMNLNKALTFTQKRIEAGKIISLYDIVYGLAGQIGAGPIGAAGSIATERILRSPATQIGVAKAIQGIGKTAPIINAVGKAIKAPAIKMITSNQK